MTWNPKREPLVNIDLNWILDNVFPEDYFYYRDEVELIDEIEINCNRDYWYATKLGMYLEHRDVLYDVFLRVSQGDFGSPDFNDNPIRICDKSSLDGHHRIISAWIFGLDIVPGVIEDDICIPEDFE